VCVCVRVCVYVCVCVHVCLLYEHAYQSTNIDSRLL
jgi:hypothetical protein